MVVGAMAWLAFGCAGDARPADTAAVVARAPARAATPAQAEAASNAPSVVIAAGDIASCQSRGDEATARLLDSLPGTVLALGDNVYRSGTAAEFATCYQPTWGRHRARTRPAPGNHEYRTRGAAPYYAYFGAAAGPPGRGYYSFDVAGWHVVSLNTNVDVSVGSTQEQWLRADLAANPTRCTLAFWHHARFGSGRQGSEDYLEPLWQALYEARADVILQAHNHTYERFAPLAPDGRVDPERGIRSFIVGTGGVGLHAFDAVVPGSEMRYNRSPGVLKLSLAPDGYVWEFIATQHSAVVDRGEGRCG